MKYIRKRFITIIIILVIIITTGIIILKVGLVKASDIELELENEEPKIVEKKETLPTEVYKKVKVDIKGQIKTPGVYELTDQERVIDVINLSGGLTKESDTSLLNLAKKVYDEMVIVIYSKEYIKKLNSVENPPNPSCPTSINNACINKDNESNIIKNNEQKIKLNINTCTKEELLEIPGIGDSKANAIIEYRQTNKFNTLEDLTEVKGIGQSLYEKIKEYFTL